MKKVLVCLILLIVYIPALSNARDKYIGMSLIQLRIIGIGQKENLKDIQKRLKIYAATETVKSLPTFSDTGLTTCGIEKMNLIKVNPERLHIISITARNDRAFFDKNKKSFIVVSELINKPLYLIFHGGNSHNKLLQAYTKKYVEPKEVGMNPVVYTWKYGDDCFRLTGQEMVIYFGENVVEHLKILEEKYQK